MNSMKRNQNRMKHIGRKGIGLIGLILLSTLTFAQTNTSNSGNSFYGNNTVNTNSNNGLLDNWYVELNGGATVVLATLRDKPYSWAFGASLGKQLNSRFDIQARFINGKMHSEGLYGGLVLSNDVNFMDASLVLKLKLKELIFRNAPQFVNELYLFGGASYTFYDSKVINSADGTFVSGVGWDAAGAIKTNQLNSLFIPLGMGLKFNIDKSGRYYLTTDLTYYYSKDNRLDGDINPTHAAHYTYTSVGFVYNIGKSNSPQKKIARAAKERLKPSIVKPSVAKAARVRPSRSETSPSENALLTNWYAGLNLGATTMLATIRDKPYSWAVGVFFGKQLNRKIGIEANLLNGKMHAEGLYGGLNLANDVNFTDASLLLNLNLNDVIFTKSPKVIREFYLFGGAGLTFFNSKVINTADNSFVTGLGWDATGVTKTNRISTPFIPLGLGMTFNIGNTGRYVLTTEFTYRYSGDNQLDGGLTTHAAHYTYTSVGLAYNLGKQTISTQQITADAIEERVTLSAVKRVKGEIANIVQEELQPVKEELSAQSKTIASIQQEVEMRINALKETIREGVVTTKLPDGTMQATPISQLGAGATPTITSIYFAFNSLYLTPDMQREIATIARLMRKNRKLRCEISGNSSNDLGSPEYNLMLSQKRAQAVAGFLANEFGIDNERLLVKSKGVTDPLAKNLHKMNRRVDMQLFW
ncbi:MAG: OmpA family protein [Bacteroidales bacterium]|nr:OmpA family protein [Bacteroidales bacterium]